MAAVAAVYRRSLLSRLLCFSTRPSSCGDLLPSTRSFAVSPSPQNPAAVSQLMRSGFGESSHIWRRFSSATTVQELLGEVAREKQRERAEKKIAGVEVGNDDDEEDEDYMGVEKLIEKLEKQNAKERGDVNMYEEPTDSDSDEDDEALTAEKMEDEFKRKFDKHEELLQSFVDAGNWFLVSNLISFFLTFASNFGKCW